LTLADSVRLKPEKQLRRDCQADSECTLQFGLCGTSRPVRADSVDKIYLTNIPSGGPLDECFMRGNKPTKPAGRAACRDGKCVVLL